MAHNHEVGGSGTGVREDRPHSLTLDEEEALFRMRLMLPPEYILPHGRLTLVQRWINYLTGPEGVKLRALIDERRAQLPGAQRNQPAWAPNS
jgi:hypothetical protein